jgi:hypothetical protein
VPSETPTLTPIPSETPTTGSADIPNPNS